MENLHIGNKSQQDGPNLESSSYYNKTLRGGLVSSYMKRFQYYSNQKSFIGEWWWVALQLKHQAPGRGLLQI